MKSYLLIGAMSFYMGMKYRQFGKRRCVRWIKAQMRRMMP